MVRSIIYLLLVTPSFASDSPPPLTHHQNRPIITMKVNINNAEIELIDGATLAQALEKAGITPSGIAVAINETVVPKTEYATRQLAEGDSILIIKAFYGG